MGRNYRYDSTIGGPALLAEIDEYGSNATALWRDRYQPHISYNAFMYRVKKARQGYAAGEPLPLGELFGERARGCEGGPREKPCPHIERCRWLVERGRHEPAERTHIICEVPRSMVARVADAIDAQPEYRAWLATQDHQLELIEEAA